MLTLIRMKRPKACWITMCGTLPFRIPSGPNFSLANRGSASYSAHDECYGGQNLLWCHKPFSSVKHCRQLFVATEPIAVCCFKRYDPGICQVFDMWDSIVLYFHSSDAMGRDQYMGANHSIYGFHLLITFICFHTVPNQTFKSIQWEKLGSRAAKIG